MPLTTAAVSDADPGTISRPRLVGVLDRGFGHFLQGIETEPAVVDGRFVGFRIKSFAPNWLPEASSWNQPLRNADVVRRVNGLPIERPEQAFRAFETLRDAGELVLDIERDGIAKELRFPIETPPRPRKPRGESHEDDPPVDMHRDDDRDFAHDFVKRFGAEL